MSKSDGAPTQAVAGIAHKGNAAFLKRATKSKGKSRAAKKARRKNRGK